MVNQNDELSTSMSTFQLRTLTQMEGVYSMWHRDHHDYFYAWCLLLQWRCSVFPLPYILEKKPPSNRRLPRIDACPFYTPGVSNATQIINAGSRIDAGYQLRAWHLCRINVMLGLGIRLSTAMAQKRKSFDVSFKLKAVETAEKRSKEAAAREFGVDDRRIREWCG